MACRVKPRLPTSREGTDGVCATTRKDSAQSSINSLSRTERFKLFADRYMIAHLGRLFTRKPNREEPGTISALESRTSIFTYDESVVFSISCIWGLRRDAPSWACPHRERGREKHGDYRQKCCAQCSERYKTGCAQCALRVHTIATAAESHFESRSSSPSAACSTGGIAIRRGAVSNTNCSELSNRFRLFF